MDWCSASTADYDATPDVDELATGIELGVARLLTRAPWRGSRQARSKAVGLPGWSTKLRGCRNRRFHQAGLPGFRRGDGSAESSGRTLFEQRRIVTRLVLRTSYAGSAPGAGLAEINDGLVCWFSRVDHLRIDIVALPRG